MERIRRFFLEGWRAKLVSLFIAISIWYLIRSNVGDGRPDFPIPGTDATGRSGSGLEESILRPLIPAPVPVPIPIPGGDAKG